MNGFKSLVTKVGGLAISAFTRHWMSTLDMQGVLYDPAADPADASFQPSAIFIFWHEYIPAPFYLRGNCDIAMLVSRHQDAEWLSEAARHMGFQTVRGSTNRGGATALRELIDSSARMNLAITPDGPRGPRRQLAPGPVYLSSRLGIPLVPIGIGYSRYWEFGTWDRFKLPKPFARARTVVGPRIQIPAGIDRSCVEHYRERVERLLNCFTEEAELWAKRGTRKRGQIAFRREGRSLRYKRLDRQPSFFLQVADGTDRDAA